MLKSINLNLAALRTLATELNDRALLKLLIDIHDDSENLLADIIEVLEPFDSATRY
jgi:hypothetical protein